MKRIAVFLGALLTLAPFGTLSASADASSFVDTFFPSGKIPTPSAAPYLTYVNTMADGTAIGGQLNFYYDVPTEITAVFDEFERLGEDDFYTQYQIELNDGCHIQMDMKIDDGAWLSSTGDWDNLDYGEKIDTETECFKVDDVFWLDDCSRMHSVMQAYLAYYETEKEKYPFSEPCVTKDTAGFCQYDLENHTFTYRYRCYLPYSYMDFDGVGVSEQKKAIFSDWSPEASIGQAENLPILQKPDSIEAPTLSEFEVLIDNTGYCNAKYYMDIPQSVYDGQKYYLACENVFDPYLIETQIRVDDGEWTDAYGENAAWLNGGYRTTVYAADSPLAPESNVEFRARIVCNTADGMASEWSNVVSCIHSETTDAQLAANEEAALDDNAVGDAMLFANDAGIDTEPVTPSCKLCGICPVQPLGVCLFVWIGIAAVLVIAILLLVIRKSKQKKAQKPAKKSPKH